MVAALDPVRRVVNVFFNRLSNVFVLFGLALVLVGAGVQATREARLAADTGGGRVPSFDSSLRGPAMSLPVAVLPLVTPVPDAATPRPAVPDRVVIPSIGLDTPVVEVGWETRVVNGEHVGNVWQTASFAAGYHRASAPPGQVGNLVLSGHNNIDGAVFHNLHDVEPMQWIYVFAGGRRYAYVVEERFIVPEANASPEQRLDNVKWISPTPDERLTLLTCYPPWSNTHRTIVLARPIHDESLVPADAPLPAEAAAPADAPPPADPAAP